MDWEDFMRHNSRRFNGMVNEHLLPGSVPHIISRPLPPSQGLSNYSRRLKQAIQIIHIHLPPFPPPPHPLCLKKEKK